MVFEVCNASAPRKPSNGATEASGQRPGERPLRAGKPIPCGGSTWRTRETDALGATFRRKIVERARSLRVWDPTFGRGRRRPEGRTPGHLRGTRREMFEGHQRFSEGVAERRDTDVSGATEFNIGRVKAPPSR